MKAVVFAFLGTYAVDAFAQGHARLLLEDTLDHNPTRLGDMHNVAVTKEELKQAAAAADKVYHDGCTKYRSGDPNSWECVGVDHKPHNYWWSSDDSVDRMHFFKTPGNKCGAVFRGTKSGQQWLSNINGFNTVKFHGEEVHKGFARAFNGEPSGSGLIGALTWWLYTRPESAEECKNGVYFVGHSLGGAFATLADIFYENKERERGTNKKAISITFGAPQTVKYVSPLASPGPKIYNELRVFHEYDFAARSYGALPGYASYQHRGPSKRIKCDTCDCKEIHTFDASAYASAVANKCDKSSQEYHKMYFYKKWVDAPVTPTPPPTKPPTNPGKEIGMPCYQSSECISGAYCKRFFYVAGLCWPL